MAHPAGLYCALNLRARCLTPKKSSPIKCPGSGSDNPSSRVMQRSVSNAASIYLLPPSSRMPTTLPRPGSSLPRLVSPSRRASQSLTDSLRNSPWLLEGIKISEHTIRTCDLCLRRATLYPAELRVRRDRFSGSGGCGQPGSRGPARPIDKARLIETPRARRPAGPSGDASVTHLAGLPPISCRMCRQCGNRPPSSCWLSPRG